MEIKGPKGRQANLVRKVKVVKKEHLVSLGLRERGVQQVLQVCQGSKVHPDQEEALGKRAHEGQAVGRDLLERKVTLVYLVFLEEMASQVLRGHKDHRDSEGQQGPPDRREHVDLLVHLDLLDYQDFLHR